MEQLRNLGDVVRNHYEKFILTLVLLGLALAVVFVYRASQRAEAEVDVQVDEIARIKPKAVTPVDLTNATAILKAYTAPPALNFGKPHNLVNPVKWKRRPTGELLKIDEDSVGGGIGWPKMSITRLIPLTFRISLDKIPTPGGYFIGFQNEAAERPDQRKKYAPYLKLNETNKMVPRPIVLREIKGALEKPDELVIEFIDSGERISITPDKPFERIESYEADLKHEITSQTFNRLRVGSPMRFLDDDYIIIAITQNEVVASARANDKKYTVRQFAPATTNTNRTASATIPGATAKPAPAPATPTPVLGAPTTPAPATPPAAVPPATTPPATPAPPQPL